MFQAISKPVISQAICIAKDDDEERDYSESIFTACKDWSRNVIFQIGLEGFLKILGQNLN